MYVTIDIGNPHMTHDLLEGNLHTLVYAGICIATNLYQHTWVSFKKIACHTWVAYINSCVHLSSTLKI